MNYLPISLFVILSIINIISSRMKKYLITGLSKLTLAPLALISILINTNLESNTKTLIIIVYCFYLIGDAFLLSSKAVLFSIGLSSFLLGHICFVIIFIINRVSFLYLPFALIALIYPLYRMFKITKTGGKLKLPMRIYTIMMIVFIATSTLMNNPLFIIGTSIFTLSDSFIAKNFCFKKTKYSDSYVMGTYTLALIILALAMIVNKFSL